MLFAHAFVRRKNYDLVNGQFAVKSLSSFEVMLILQNIHVHNQSFSAARGAHERQLIQLVRRIWLKINLNESLQPRIQIVTEIFRVGKISVKIHFREEQRDVLKIFPVQTVALFLDSTRMSADIVIIQPKFIRRNICLAHLADVSYVLVKISIAAFVDALIIGAVKFLAQVLKRIQLQLVQKIFEQHKLIVKINLRRISSCHNSSLLEHTLFEFNLRQTYRPSFIVAAQIFKIVVAVHEDYVKVALL